MRRNVLALDAFGIEVLLVDLDLIVEPGDIGHVDLHRAVAEGFHELVVLQAVIFRLVGMAEDDLINVRLGELLGLDLVFLSGTEQVVKECHVELEHFDELDQAAVGDVQLAIKVEGPRIAVGAILGDFAVVDIARQFGGVLVLLVLGLEGANAEAILLGQNKPKHLDLFEHPCPVAVMLGETFVGTSVRQKGHMVATDRHLKIAGLSALVQPGQDWRPQIEGNQVERLLVHGAFLPGTVRHPPGVSEKHAGIWGFT